MDKSLLSDATSADDSPVSGYMLKEIARSTVASYPACSQLIDFLGSRIRKNDRSVKYKCCVIIKHVCREGRVEFKREVSRILDAIKECTQWKGEIDTLRGDEPNQRVRTAAKEALDAIFDSQMPVTVSSVAQANRIQAFGGGYEESPYNSNQTATTQSGSTSYLKSLSSKMSSMLGDDGAAYVGHPGATDMNPDGHIGAGGRMSYPPSNSGSYGGPSGPGGGNDSYESRSSSDMQGFGSGPDPRDEKSWMQKLGDVASSAKEKVSGLRSGSGTDTTVRFANDSSNYSNYSSNRGDNAHGRGINNSYSPSSATPSSAAGLAGAKSGPYGSSASGSSTTEEPTLEPGSGGIVPDMPSRPGYGRAGSAAADGSYEAGVVASLCEPGGMKAVPPQDKLNKFLTSAPTLSPEIVGSCLLGQLNEDTWQTRVKALMVISSLAMASGCEQHRIWWSDEERIEEITTICQSDSKASVRTQASKTLRAIGAPGVAHPSPSAHAAPRQATLIKHDAPPMSLLDDYDEPTVAVAHSYTAAFEPNVGPSSISQGPPVPPMALPSDINDGGGLFDGMDMGVSSAPASVLPATSISSAVAAVAHDPHLVASVSNLLNDMDPYSSVAQLTPAPVQVNNNISSAFNGLDLIDADAVDFSQPHQQTMNAFADLEPTLGRVPAGPAAPSTGMYPVVPAGINGQPLQGYYQPQQQQPYAQQPYLSRPPPQQGQYYGQTYGHSGATVGYQQPAPVPMPYQPMGFTAAPRKEISSLNAEGGSGFSFMGESKSGGGDSFNFVNDVIKSSSGSNKRK